MYAVIDALGLAEEARLDILVAKTVGFDKRALHNLRRRIAADPSVAGASQ